MPSPTWRDAVLLLALHAVSAAHARVDLPGTLAASQGFQLLGSGSMTWYGLHLYDAALWTTAGTFDPQRPYALALRYTRGFKGDRIAERSTLEIERLGLGDAATRARWETAMRRLFPDVARGDTLVGVYRPGVGAEFFHNGARLGTIDDAQFAHAFFSIWLDPRTREPKLRERLIGVR
jgi:hypothetical protein